MEADNRKQPHKLWTPKDFDEALVAAKRGDLELEAEIHRRSVRIGRAIYLRNRSSWQLPEDEAMSLLNTAIAKCMEKFTPESGSFPAYLAQAYRRLISDRHLRPKKDACDKESRLDRIDAGDERDEDPRPWEVADPGLNPEEALLLREQHRVVSRKLEVLLGLLSSNERAAFLMHLEGCSNKTISESLGGMNATNLIFHAKVKMRSAYAAAY